LDNKYEQHYAAVTGMMNTLQQRRKDVAIINQELQEIIKKLDSEELEDDVEVDLEGKARDRRALKRHHLKEIKKLEAKTTITVNYNIVKTGLTAVLSPGLMLHPEFLLEPVCWCPINLPESKLIDEMTTMVEELPLSLTSAQHTTAKGSGLEECFHDKESKFVITAKDFSGKPRDIGGDEFVLESKESDIKYTVVDKKNGTYEVSYYGGHAEVCGQLILDVTLRGRSIQGSPFSVNRYGLLLEFSTNDDHGGDWLDAAVARMSNIPRARLCVILHDANGGEVYKSTGVTTCKWTQEHITSPGPPRYDVKHTNAIVLDNGDRLMIMGKHQINGAGYGGSPYLPYNIIINAGWDKGKLSSWKHPRRMIIGRNMPYVPGWTAPDNRISFSNSGFTQTSAGNWPKFNGTFRIYYKSI